MLGAIITVISIILANLFMFWALFRISSIHSRIEEQYRIRDKKKKGKK